MAQDYVGQYNMGKSKKTGNYLDTSGDGKEYSGVNSNTNYSNVLAGGLTVAGGLIPTAYNFIQGSKDIQPTNASQFYNPYETQIKDLYGRSSNMWNSDPTTSTYSASIKDMSSTADTVNNTFDASQNASRQYSESAIQTLKDRRYNIDPILQQAELSSRIGAEDARQYSSTGSEYMNRRNSLLNDRTRNVAQAVNTKNNVEAQYLGDTANAMMGRSNQEQSYGQERNQANLSLLAQRMQAYTNRSNTLLQQQAGKANSYTQQAAGYTELGNQRSQADMFAYSQDAAANAAKKNYLAKGFEGLGTVVTAAAPFFI